MKRILSCVSTRARESQGMFDFGQGVPEDDAEAVRWYHTAGPRAWH